MMEPVPNIPNSIAANQYNNYGFPKNMKNVNAYMQKKSCVPTAKINGKIYYVRVDCKGVCPRINRVLNENFDNAPDGIYTYMLYKKGGQLGFAYVKVQSVMEYGSLHKTLFYEIGPEEVIISGECKKEGTNISYNFQSGTYAAPIFEKHNYNAPKQEEYAHTKITPLLVSLYPMLAFTYSTKPSFITSSLRVSIEEIQELEARGFVVNLFEDKVTCGDCGSYQSHQSTIDSYKEAIQNEEAGMKKNPKLYKGYTIPFWRSEIERIQAIIDKCSAPQLRLHNVLAGGKRKTRTTRKHKQKKHYKRRHTLKH